MELQKFILTTFFLIIIVFIFGNHIVQIFIAKVKIQNKKNNKKKEAKKKKKKEGRICNVCLAQGMHEQC